MCKRTAVKVFAFFAALFLAGAASQSFAAAQESAYERVMRTRTLKCGYLPYEPFIIKDANTGRMSGLIVDYLEAAAARRGMRIEWSMEVNVDQVVPALEARRFDVFCLPCTPDSVWEKVVDFTAYLGAVPYYIYVRDDSSLSRAQLETARFAIVDGYALTEITKKHFPYAALSSLPQTTSMADMYNQLRFKKVDAHVNEAISAFNYDANNPGIIKSFSKNPLELKSMFLVSRKGDKDMRGFLDETFGTQNLENFALALSHRKKFRVPDNVFVLGPLCTGQSLTATGEKTCAQP